MPPHSPTGMRLSCQPGGPRMATNDCVHIAFEIGSRYHFLSLLFLREIPDGDWKNSSFCVAEAAVKIHLHNE